MITRSMTVVPIGTCGLATILPYVGLPVGRPFQEDDHEIASLQRLVLAGDEHAKLMRLVMVWFDIRAPRYWWQQFATYRVGVEMYSESTMHTLMDGIDDDDDFAFGTDKHSIEVVRSKINRNEFIGAKTSLPEGFLQRRLVMISYQTLRRIWLHRQHHRLTEWHIFIQALGDLPYADELIFCKEEVTL